MSGPDLGQVVGCQEPTVYHVPEYESSRGDEVIGVAERAGLVLDPWQRFVVTHSLGVDADGRWAAFEVGVDVPRQNGKGGILEALELGALFVLEEQLTVHSAHQFDTSLEAFRRLLMLIEDTPDLDQQVKRVSRSHGEEGIELKHGRRVRFRTRTKGGGRGFSCDRLILDEAMFLPEMAHGALLPTLAARPNPQVIYTGSAVDQEVHEHGVVFARVRDRGHKRDKGMAYFEWTADPQGDPNDVGELLRAEAAWARANPGLGIRISADHVDNEMRSMDPRTFAVERLGVGDWPALALAGDGLNLNLWLAGEDKRSEPIGPVCFAFDVTPQRGKAAIALAGRREDGDLHLQVMKHKAGTDWVLDTLIDLIADHDCVDPVCDELSPAAALLARAENLDLDVVTVNAREHAQACGMLVDAVEQGTVKHHATDEMTAAVKGAGRRPLGDAWAWSRTKSTVDISPLVAATLALWGLETQAATAGAPLVAFT